MERKLSRAFLAGSIVYVIKILIALLSFQPLFIVLKQGIITFIITFILSLFLFYLVQILPGLNKKQTPEKIEINKSVKDGEGVGKEVDDNEGFSPLKPSHIKYEDNSTQKRVD